jgi:hypothetical protein
VAKPKFSFDKHRNTGSKLKRVRGELVTLNVEIANSYAHTSKASRCAKKALEAVDALICELDSQLFRDCPIETAGDKWKGVYYGAPRLEVVRRRDT